MPTPHTAIERLTADDYRAMPEDGRRYQLLDGELHIAPAPNRFHQTISWNIAGLLSRYLTSHPVGRAFTAPFDVYLDGSNVVQPDLLFIAAPTWQSSATTACMARPIS